MSKITNLCPHIPSENPKRTQVFFEDVFQFKVLFEYEGYIELEKEGMLIGIIQAQGTPNEQSLYLRMEGIDQFWLEYKDKLLSHKAREPFTQDYGMKEIHVVAPETNTLLFIGEQV